MKWDVTGLPLERFGCKHVVLGRDGRGLVFVHRPVAERFAHQSDRRLEDIYYYIELVIRFHASNAGLLALEDDDGDLVAMMCSADTKRGAGVNLYFVLMRSEKEGEGEDESKSPFVLRFSDSNTLRSASDMTRHFGIVGPPHPPPCADFFSLAVRQQIIESYVFNPSAATIVPFGAVERVDRFLRQMGAHARAQHVVSSSLTNARERPYDVVPQWVPDKNNFQLLAPLVEHNTVLGALVLALSREGQYCVVTALDLRKAYNHANVVMCVPPAWMRA